MKNLLNTLKGLLSDSNKAMDFIFEHYHFNQIKHKQYFTTDSGYIFVDDALEVEYEQELEVVELTEKNNSDSVVYAVIHWDGLNTNIKLFDDMIDSYQAMNELDDLIQPGYAIVYDCEDEL